MQSRSLLLFAVLVMAACAGNINPTQQLDDAALATRVREVLQADALLGAYRVNVDARRGVVTLTGTVPNDALRDRATMIVSSVPEVGHVENLMSVQ